MEHNPAQPETGGLDVKTEATIDVPQGDWLGHSLLRRARLNAVGDGIEWPEATIEQLPSLREITLVVVDGVSFARMVGQFNFDRFVDATTDDHGPAQPAGHVSDRQRFYTRVTSSGFHVVGVFSAATIAGRRRYFQWLTGAWVEIGLNGFLYVRDDHDTHFSEVTSTQLDETQPGATTTPMTDDEEWTVESVQNRFVGDPVLEPVVAAAPTPATEPLFEPVIEPLTAANFPHIAPPDPVSIANFPPPPVVASGPALLDPPVAHDPAPVDPAPADPAPVAPPPPAAVRVAADPTGAVQHGIAAALATVAHRGDVDLLGSATIDHVARVAETFDANSDYIRHCAAWLHDALEHSDLTQRDLLEAGVQPEIVHIVSLLTRREGGDEDAWLTAISEHPDALAVKLVAVRDNGAPWRLRRLDLAARARIERELARTLAALKG